MYRIGDFVIYSNSGVCKITDIVSRKDGKTEQLYYVLLPLYQTCTIYTPIDNDKVFMRPVITKTEANRLIDMIPTINAEAYHNRSINQLSEHYNEALKTHDCSDLIELCMSIYAKKQSLEQQNRKFGAVDEKFMKRAEELLHGELAVALGIEKDQVPAYIAERIANNTK